MKATSLQFLQDNVDPATDLYVFLMGYYAPDDGGEGEFFWDNGNTDTVNGGTIVASLYPCSKPRHHPGQARLVQRYQLDRCQRHSGLIHFLKMFPAKTPGTFSFPNGRLTGIP
ncbi:hypothetical protein [Taibaiella koreensis]|uniref:hypothetical protein n=1 Tax=Taibaiella koreensis TaxID=1268548 RepID=UPI0013C2EFDC|nr:hypothetical protein [Taibaiella koreensis]